MVIVSAVVTFALIVVALVLPVPYVRLSPGPTFNVIGDHDGAPVITINGATTYPTSGELDMTTVYERGGPRTGLTFLEAIAAWVNPTDAVVPRELLYPDDVTGEEVKQRQAMLFNTSESNAIAAAMSYLDLPVSEHIVVSVVYGDSPADGKLEAGDRIVSVNGTAMDSPAQVAEAIRSKPAGSSFDVVVERSASGDGDAPTTEQVAITLTSAKNPEDETKPYIGIGVGTQYDSGFDITFSLEDIGGPSAGLVFATALVDKLTPDGLVGDRHVAATGTIEPDGTVGRIGGIRQKLAGAAEAGATYFLMPRDHCSEAAGHIPDGLTVAPVSNLADAISALQAWNRGESVPGCPADVTAAGVS